MTVGEIEEIKTQSVNMNDYIRQYAVVKYVTDGTTYLDYCPDCSCVLTVNKEDGTNLFSDHATTEISKGLFGYRTNPQEFIIEHNYQAVFNCTSPVRGSGLVYSEVNILPFTLPTAFTTDNDVVLETNTIKETIDNTLEDLFDTTIFGGGVLNVFTDIGQNIKMIVNYFLTFILGDELNGEGGLIGFFVIFGKILFLVLTDTPEGLKQMYALFFALIKPVVYLISVPIVLYEFYVMTFKCSGKNFMGAVNEFIEGQVNVIKFIKFLFDESLAYSKLIIYVCIDVVKAVPFM